MSKAKHTQGPWQVVPPETAQSRWIVGDAEGGSIADCAPPGPWMTAKVADANASLIAAAPDMLAALMAFNDAWGTEDSTAYADKINAANKVDGRRNRQGHGMIDRQGNRIILECDSCSEVFDGEEGEEFAGVWSSAKRDGWRTRKVANEWLHGCPRCGVPK